jgi:hypothetical protein
MALNPRFKEFCNRWLEKAKEYDETELSQLFDKFFTLYVVYNALYVLEFGQLKLNGQIVR